MTDSQPEHGAQFYADTYDASTPDWPQEIDFYLRMAEQSTNAGSSVLELACGTGRVAIRLAQNGASVVGLDNSDRLLAIARQKSAGIANSRWVEGDMRNFEIGESFGLILIPGHAFHNLNTAGEQLACLQAAARHLEPGGRLVVHLDHQDLAWLGSLVGEKGGQFEPAETFIHPSISKPVRAWRAWSYEPATQTNVCQTRWEELDDDGAVINQWQTDPLRLHCVFRFEMEHLLPRVGFTIEALYGDFAKQSFKDDSPEMVWVARKEFGWATPVGWLSGIHRNNK